MLCCRRSTHNTVLLFDSSAGVHFYKDKKFGFSSGSFANQVFVCATGRLLPPFQMVRRTLQTYFRPPVMPREVNQTPTKELCSGEMSVRDRNDTKSQGFPFGQGTITEINHYSLEELKTGRQKTRK